MMGKEIFTLFTIFLVTVTFFPSGSAAEKELLRRKRNIICLFGLNGLISDMFYEALNTIRQFDPMYMGSLLFGHLKNGEFHGLSTLNNDSTIDAYCQNKMIILDTLLGMNDVSFNFQWSIKALLTFTGTVSVKVKKVQFYFDTTLNMDSGLVMDVNVGLTQLGGMSLGFSGFGPFNPMVRLVGDIVLDIFHHIFAKEIESNLKNTLQSEMRNFKMSF